jgi:hypothetical protein
MTKLLLQISYRICLRHLAIINFKNDLSALFL